MSMTETELKQVIANNIHEYRKLLNMSQIELATKLNYSDKAISKWERAESVPDIYVLTQIADIFGITVNDLLKTKTKKIRQFDLKALLRKKIFVLSLSIGLVWLIATVIFSMLSMSNIRLRYTLYPFLFAIPITFLICIIFTSIWKRRIGMAISQSLFIWSVFLSICLTVPYTKIWFLLLISIPAQVLIILWNLMKHKKHT